MSISATFNNLSKEGGIGYAILGLVAIAAFVTIHAILKSDVQQGAKAIGSAASATLDAASGFATGNLASAHGTPYEGAGIFGSIGLGVNSVLGGLPERAGNWIGEQLSPDYDPSESSLQHANNNPYGGGPSASYADAVDNSPTAAQYAANPNTQTPVDDFSAVTGTW